MNKLPSSLSDALRQLEKRWFQVLLGFGLGRFLRVLSLVLAALFLIDWSFAPPWAARLGLTLMGVVFCLRSLWRDSFLPLRRRPQPEQLAAQWEKSHPELAGRVSTLVELNPRAEGSHSSALLEQVRSDLATTAPRVQLARAFPHQRAVTTFCLGLLFAGVLTGLGWAFPQERSIFFARLMGQNVSWPQQTTLALLPPFVDGLDAESFVETKPQRWELSVLEGSNVHLRVRADGLIPDAVHAELNGVQRSMRSLTGGTFAIRLPSLQENQTVTFHGGDDQDDLPVLLIQVGRSPELKAWSVAVAPPAYTGIPAFQSDQHELNVPEGSALTLTFEPLELPAEIGITENGGYTPLTPNAQGAVSYSTVVEGHGEVAIHILGQDGFANPRAAQFLWKSIRDRPPRLEHLWPPRSWNTLVGGSLPISFSLKDEYG
ncbi:MAG: DUF4175 domain-containing protein, partial [Planctomycetes bacterium]|nr:DUF4175 domain-containing protein [Planctomycetota bacterium]